MTTNTTVTVPANPDQDDCLAAAEAAYIAQHTELEGWDLEPRWEDEETRERVVLTVPTWHVTEADPRPVFPAPLHERSVSVSRSRLDQSREDLRSAIDAEIEERDIVLLLGQEGVWGRDYVVTRAGDDPRARVCARVLKEWARDHLLPLVVGDIALQLDHDADLVLDDDHRYGRYVMVQLETGSAGVTRARADVARLAATVRDRLYRRHEVLIVSGPRGSDIVVEVAS